MPSPEASRRNLANYWNRVGRPRSRDESILHWWLTLQWWTRDQHNPKLQREWADQLEVSQPYASKMVKRLKREWLDLAGRWTGWQEVTLNDLRRAREVRKHARARMAEARSWERYDAEQRRKQRGAEYRERYGYEPDESRLDEYIAEQQPASEDDG